MVNRVKTQTVVDAQDPKVRATNFNEVSLGYSEEEAIDEAQRCLTCPDRPCSTGCPVGINIPAFIENVANGDFDAAADELYKYTSLPAICGRVCPQESQCEKYCVRGKHGDSVAIGRLERFVADYKMKRDRENTEDKPVVKGAHADQKVAIVGSGPSGLTAAGELAKRGYSVSIFEALHKAGGVLVYGIPNFRLPKDIVQQEIDSLKHLGVEVDTNTVIGKTFTIDELFERGYEAVFVGSGAGLPKFMNIPGEGLSDVFSANEFLTRINLMKGYEEGAKTPVIRPKKVAIVGGGNVALDAARCALRLGAEVSIVYRRSMEEMPARLEEIEHAQEEGINFMVLTNPKEILGDEQGHVTGMRCRKCELGEPDASGRRRPVEIEGSDFVLDVDAVVMSIGTTPNPLITTTTKGLDTQSWGGIIVDETGKTSKEGVWAGGDITTGAATVILAMGAGKTAAKSIDEYLTAKRNK